MEKVTVFQKHSLRKLNIHIHGEIMVMRVQAFILQLFGTLNSRNNLLV